MRMPYLVLLPALDPSTVTSPQIFRDSPFSTCDARALQIAWGLSSLKEAEIEASRRMAAGRDIRPDLEIGYRTTSYFESDGPQCTLEEAGWTEDSLTALAREIFVDSLAEAREHAEDKLDQAHAYQLELMQKEAGPDPRGPVYGNLDGLYGGASHAHFEEQYSYCDAEVLAVIWQRSSREAAFLAGRHIRAGRGAQVERALTQGFATARSQGRTCSPEQGLYSPEELAALASHWESDEAAARDRVEDKLMNRDRASIDLALRAAGRSTPDMRSRWEQANERGTEAAGRDPLPCNPGHCLTAGWITGHLRTVQRGDE